MTLEALVLVLHCQSSAGKVFHASNFSHHVTDAERHYSFQNWRVLASSLPWAMINRKVRCIFPHVLHFAEIIKADLKKAAQRDVVVIFLF